jgi:protein-tyrosine-phosphatase
MLQVLFVCTANICRSPYMELAGRALLGTGSSVQLSSAGTLGFVGRPMNDTMAGTLVDIDPSGFRSRRLTPAMIDEADLVLTAEDEHRQFILVEQPGAFRKVFSLGQFASAVQRLDSRPSGSTLVDAVASTSGISQIRADVADPYRRGRRAAAVCARQIDELLAVVLPALDRGAESAPEQTGTEENA